MCAGTDVLAATGLHGERRGLELAADFNDCGDAMAIGLARRDKAQKGIKKRQKAICEHRSSYQSELLLLPSRMHRFAGSFSAEHFAFNHSGSRPRWCWRYGARSQGTGRKQVLSTVSVTWR